VLCGGCRGNAILVVPLASLKALLWKLFELQWQAMSIKIASKSPGSISPNCRNIYPLAALRIVLKKLCTVATVIWALVSLTPVHVEAQPAAGVSTNDSAIDVVKAYLQATHARDFATAYGYASTADRRAREKRVYLRSQESFNGFALDLAKRLAAGMEIWTVEQKLGPSKAQLEVGYRAPTADELTAQLLDWNPAKLNALSPAQQSALFGALSKLQDSGKMITVEGRDRFDLVREKDGWKIFFDWSAHHRVVFKTTRNDRQDLEVRFLRNDLFVKRKEPFQIDLTVTNRTDRALDVKLNHLFEPRETEKNVDMIACGSLAPLRLRPQEAQKISSVYLLRGNLPGKAPIAILYDFNVARPQEKRFARLKSDTR